MKNVSAREQLGKTYDDPLVQRNIDLDMTVLECYHRELSQVEWLLEKQAKKHQPTYYHLLTTIPGVGRILALTILYEVGNIRRFDSVQKFASYSRLIKCKAESAGKAYDTQGNKIGNTHLKWAFSECFICAAIQVHKSCCNSSRNAWVKPKPYRLWPTSWGVQSISC